MIPRLVFTLPAIVLLCACTAPPPETAPTAGPAPAAATAAEPPSKPDVIVCLIDTLRKDHLGCYYYPLDTSPTMDAVAREGVIFRELVPMSSWTRPSVASLLTGTMDYTHHALSMEDHLRKGLPSLAQVLKAAGWRTHSIITNPAVSATFGFGADFEKHTDIGTGRPMVTAKEDIEAVDLALRTIADAGAEPLFMYLHLMAPHREYAPPAEYRDLFMPEKFVGTREQVRIAKDMALYDAEIRFADAQLQRVVQALKDAGRYDNAMMVILSDHGEQFMEHGEWAHSNTLHVEELGVPFIMKLPRNEHAGREVTPLVQMADVAPTILAALGVAAAAGMEGRSLMPLINLQGDFEIRPAVARLRFSQRHFFMAQTIGLKYIHDAALGEDTWYDLENDPNELRPLRRPPAGGEELKRHALEYAARPVPAMGESSPPMTQQQRQELEALGYL